MFFSMISAVSSEMPFEDRKGTTKGQKDCTSLRSIGNTSPTLNVKTVDGVGFISLIKSRDLIFVRKFKTALTSCKCVNDAHASTKARKSLLRDSALLSSSSTNPKTNSALSANSWGLVF